MFVSEEKDKLMNKGHLSPYDIVLTSRGTIGNVAYMISTLSMKMRESTPVCLSYALRLSGFLHISYMPY